MELSDQLKPLTEKQKEYCWHVYHQEGDQLNNLCTCLECGHQWRRASKIGKAEKAGGACWHAAYSYREPKYEWTVCPHCHKKIRVHHSNYQKKSIEGVFGVIDYIDGYQVCRYFLTRKTIDRKHPAKCETTIEVLRIFLEVNGSREFYVARALTSAASWVWTSNLELRGGLYYSNPYNITTECICRSLAPEYKNIRWHNTGLSARDTFIAFKDPHAMTLYEAGMYNLFDKCAGTPRLTDNWDTLKICIRNHYDPKDADMYFDYLHELEELGKDLHNPAYVCPKDLLKAHTRYHRIIERRENAEEAKREKDNIIKSELTYKKQKQRYLDIVLSGKNLTIRPLQSVKEFFEEGQAMHHCVYSNGYYRSASALILSAKDNSGNRLATIEFDTTGMQVMQCRAACNQVPERFNEICSLIQDNIKVFKDARKGTKQKAAI
jgi:hypothetical protein